MNRLWIYLKPYKTQSIMGPLFKLLEACFELFVPVVMANIIDVGIAAHDTSHVLKMGGLLIGLGALGLICSVSAQYFAARAATGMGEGIRNALFAHILRLYPKNTDKLGISSLITRMTGDCDRVQTGVNLGLRLLMRTPFIVIGALIMAFTINARLALIFAVTSVLISLTIWLIMKRTLPRYRNIQEQTDVLSRLTRENLTGARVVRAFNTQSQENAEFEREADKNTRSLTGAGRISALLNPVNLVVVNLALAAILIAGGRTVYTGALTQGELIALINYMGQILIALVVLFNLILTLTRASASASRIAEVLETEPAVADNLSSTEPGESEFAVRFNDVTFSYSPGRPVLEHISFYAMRSERVGIIGGTGDGKTTLVKLMLRLYEPDSGTVELFGRDVRSYSINTLRSTVTSAAQHAVLISGTVRDNLKIGAPDASDESLDAALTTAQAYDFVYEKGGLDFEIEQDGRNLSGGQKQRLTVARALAVKSPVLILDDAASALDLATDARLFSALSRDTRDVCVFIVSQRISSIKRCDRIIVLDDGSIAGIGTHDELFLSCPRYKEIFLSQSGGEAK